MTFFQNVASANRDAHLARLMEGGVIRTWADGFGLWHALVPVGHKGSGPETPAFAHPMEVAKYAIRLQLQQRAPRDSYVDVQPIRMVARDFDNHTVEYVEDTTRDQ